MQILIILFRWLHLIAASLTIGGTFFIRFILPLGLAQIDPPSREAVFLKCRRAFKMTVHPCILFLLLSGVFNTWRNWADYKLNLPTTHLFWGTHLILGLIAITISLIVLAPKSPPVWHRKAVLYNFILLLAVVALASASKYVREQAVKNPKTPTTTSVR